MSDSNHKGNWSRRQRYASVKSLDASTKYFGRVGEIHPWTHRRKPGYIQAVQSVTSYSPKITNANINQVKTDNTGIL